MERLVDTYITRGGGAERLLYRNVYDPNALINDILAP